MKLTRLCSLLFFLSAPALFSAASPAIARPQLRQDCADDPRFTLHLMNQLFLIHRNQNAGFDLYQNEWVKPILLTLAVTNIDDPAPELCRKENLLDAKSEADKFNFATTNLETFRAGLWMKNHVLDNNLADERIRLKQKAQLAGELATWWSRLKWLDEIQESATEVASGHEDLDARKAATILFSEKRQYDGYCEIAWYWREAPSELRKGLMSPLRLFVALAMRLAQQTGTEELFAGFVLRMELSFVESSIDPHQDPFERFYADLLAEAHGLNIGDKLDKIAPKQANAEEEIIMSVINSRQAYEMLEAILWSWEAEPGEIYTTALPFHKKMDPANKYAKLEINQQLGAAFREFRANFRERLSNSSFEEIGALKFALDAHGTTNRILSHINDISREYRGLSYETFREDFREKNLIHRPKDKGPIEMRLYLRWLKTASYLLGLQANFEAFLIVHGLKDFAPVADDMQNIWDWLGINLPKIAEANDVVFPPATIPGEDD